MDYNPPGSSVHGILQARILEWVAISFSRGSPQPRDQTQVFRIAGRFFTTSATWELDLQQMVRYTEITVIHGGIFKYQGHYKYSCIYATYG